ncbi:MAG: hypothetical protein ACKV2V_24475 [Blastocatellia bacterium]
MKEPKPHRLYYRLSLLLMTAHAPLPGLYTILGCSGSSQSLTTG